MTKRLIGKVLLNQYRVEEFITATGMSAVYRVWDLKRNVYLAMKVLHSELAEDPSVFKLFRREANALKKLAHPNIVPFYGLQQSGDLVFLLEQFIDGPTLKEIMQQAKGKPLSIDQALIYLKALCAALGYAHSHGVVHCDVKPGNVMVDQGGKIYLTDFGIARHAESTTTTLGAAGTPSYMSPEQIRAERLTPATDVYGLGVMLFEMETGRRPFIGDEAGTLGEDSTASERIRHSHQYLKPPDIRQFNPNLPEALAQVVMKAMAKSPTDRYASMQSFLSSACVAVGTIPAQIPDRIKGGFKQEPQPPPLPSELIDETGPRFPYAKLALGIGGLLLVIIIGFFSINALMPPPPPSLQASPVLPTNTGAPIENTSTSLPNPTSTILVETNLGETSSPTSTAISTPTPTLDPSIPHGKVVFTCQSYLDNQRDQICMIDLEDFEQRQLSNVDYADHGYPSLSPDGESIVYSSNQDGNFEIFEMDFNGSKRQLTNDLGKLYAPEISPNGEWITFTNTHDGKQTLWVMNRDGSNAHEIHAPAVGDLADPTWSPDSEEILFAMGTDVENKQLFIIDRNGNNLRPVPISISGTRGRSDWSPDGSLIATYIRTNPNDRWSREIYFMDLMDSSANQVTHGGQNLSPSFSPDGNWITFMSYRDKFKDPNGCEIYIMRLDDEEVQRLTDNNYCDYQPRWGP